MYWTGKTRNFSYADLEKWGVADIHNGKIIWDA